jgi:hypothetical protein
MFVPQCSSFERVARAADGTMRKLRVLSGLKDSTG